MRLEARGSRLQEEENERRERTMATPEVWASRVGEEAWALFPPGARSLLPGAWSLEPGA